MAPSYDVFDEFKRQLPDIDPQETPNWIDALSEVVEQESPFPGDEAMELRIRRMIRWNAVAMVLRANNAYPGIGGQLATYASAASFYEVGFNHFFRGRDAPGGGDQVFFQGRAAPGIYATASGPTGRSRPARARASSSSSCPPSTGWPTWTPP
jgi:pyruvate dehydrogenase E1 component